MAGMSLIQLEVTGKDRLYGYYILRKVIKNLKLGRKESQEVKRIMLKFSPGSSKISLGPIQVRILRNILYQILKVAVALKDEDEQTKLLSLLQVIEDEKNVSHSPPRST